MKYPKPNFKTASVSELQEKDLTISRLYLNKSYQKEILSL